MSKECLRHKINTAPNHHKMLRINQPTKLQNTEFHTSEKTQAHDKTKSLIQQLPTAPRQLLPECLISESDLLQSLQDTTLYIIYGAT